MNKYTYDEMFNMLLNGEQTKFHMVGHPPKWYLTMQNRMLYLHTENDVIEWDPNETHRRYTRFKIV